MKKFIRSALCAVLCVHFLMIQAYTNTTQEQSTWRHRPIIEDINWRNPADVATKTTDSAYDIATTPLRVFSGN